MTEVDKVFQVAARRIQGLTAKVNHWKQRANELEAALGTEKAARIEAEATLSKTVNSWVGQVDKPDRDALAAQVRRLDPPEATHDTPAQDGDIKVGDYVEVFQDTGYWTRRSDIGVAGKVSFTNGEYCHIPQGDGYYKVNLCDVRKIQREPKPGDVVRLVREPTHTDIPAMLPWSKAFGMPGDTATVVIMAVPDKIPNGTIPVRTSMGRAFFWPLSCIEIVDAK